MLDPETEHRHVCKPDHAPAGPPKCSPQPLIHFCSPEGHGPEPSLAREGGREANRSGARGGGLLVSKAARAELGPSPTQENGACSPPAGRVINHSPASPALGAHGNNPLNI